MTNQAKCIAVLEATFTTGGQDTEEFLEYSRRSSANGQAHGGKPISKFIINKNLAQGNTPHIVFILEFPSVESAEAAFNSEEYRAILPLREVAFEQVKILLSEKFEQFA